MARLPYLEADQVAPEYRDMLKRNTNLHKLLANSPDMAIAFNSVGNFMRCSRSATLNPSSFASLRTTRGFSGCRSSERPL